MENLELAKMANEIRKGIIIGVHSAKCGHPGGSRRQRTFLPISILRR